MNKQSMMIRIGTALALLAVLTASASATATVWFEPDPSTIDLSPGETVTVQIMSDIDATENGIRSFQIGVDFDPSVINITVEQPLLPEPLGGMGLKYWQAVHKGADPSDEDPGPLGAWVWIIGSNSECYTAAGNPPMHPALPVPLANLSIEGIGHGTSPLNITTETRLEPTRGDTRIINCSHVTMDAVYNNNAIECNEVTTFAKDLIEGWNLISLPLTPEDNSTSAVLSSISGNYDAVFRYGATAKQFEVVTDGTMDPGIGYFVDVTTAGTWSYAGSYTSISVDLKPGLNCIGWGYTSADLPDAMSLISGKYNYVARWNASDPKYEVYDANAPAGVSKFIDFTTMGQGNGYWIAAKGDCTLNV